MRREGNYVNNGTRSTEKGNELMFYCLLFCFCDKMITDPQKDKIRKYKNESSKYLLHEILNNKISIMCWNWEISFLIFSDIKKPKKEKQTPQATTCMNSCYHYPVLYLEQYFNWFPTLLSNFFVKYFMKGCCHKISQLVYH